VEVGRVSEKGGVFVGLRTEFELRVENERGALVVMTDENNGYTLLYPNLTFLET
jgi:hypothetical protein